MTEPIPTPDARPAPTYKTRPAFTATPGVRPPAAQPTGMLQVAILGVLGGLLVIIGMIMALGANGLQISLVVFGSGLVVAGTVAITGALVVQALRRR